MDSFEPLTTARPVGPQDLVSEPVRALLDESGDAILGGKSLAEQRGIAFHDMAARFDHARLLAEEGHLEKAFSIAFDLFAAEPREWRFAYLAGACLRHLGEPAKAVPFLLAAADRGRMPEAVFGLGSCFEELGDRESAIRCYDEVWRMTHGMSGHEDLRQAAMDAAHELHQGENS